MKNLLLMLWIIGGAFSVSAQVTVPDLKKVVEGAANAPDVTITNIQRVAGKNELKVTIANKGKNPASNVKLTIYALPYGFCSKQSPYTPADENGGYPCFDNPSEIPAAMLITSIDGAKTKLGLAWASVQQPPFGMAGNTHVEKTLQFPAQPPPALPGQSKKKVFPVPYFQFGSSYLFAPSSILTFDLSVFYAVVEAEGEMDKTNNEYFFNIRQRPN